MDGEGAAVNHMIMKVMAGRGGEGEEWERREVVSIPCKITVSHAYYEEGNALTHPHTNTYI